MLTKVKRIKRKKYAVGDEARNLKISLLLLDLFSKKLEQEMSI